MAVILPCAIISIVGLYLLRVHELNEAVSSLNHLTRSLGHDLEMEAVTLANQAIEAVAVGKGKGDSKLQSKLLASGQAAFFSGSQLKPNSNPSVAWTDLGTGRGWHSKSFESVASGVPGFFLRVPASGGAYTVVEVALSRWHERLRASMAETAPWIVGILPKYEVNDRNLLLYPLEREAGYSADRIGRLAELAKYKEATDSLRLADEIYVVCFHNIPLLRERAIGSQKVTWVRLVLALPHAYIYRQWWLSLWMVCLALAVMTGMGLALISRYVRARQNSDQKLLDAMRKVTEGGQTAAIVDNLESYAKDKVLREFSNMGRGLAESQLRTRVLTRVVQDLYSQADQVGILCVGLELLCTQCQAEVAIFVPISDPSGFIWRQHRIEQLNRSELVAIANSRVDSERITFAVHVNNEIFGTVHALYAEKINDFVGSLVQGTSALLDLSLGRLEVLSEKAYTKLRQNILKTLRLHTERQEANQYNSGMIARFSRSIDNDSSGWLECFEHPTLSRIFLTIGDLKGPGESTGLIALSVTRAIQAFWQVLSANDDMRSRESGKLIAQMASIIEKSRVGYTSDCGYLVAIVDVESSELLVINRGFAPPLLVERSDSGNNLRLIDSDLNWSGDLGDETQRHREAITNVFKLDPRSCLVFYSDGISVANNLRPGTFRRLLQRCLESSTNIGKPYDLRDEIVSMLKYYMQQPEINQRVNLLCLSLECATAGTRVKTSSSVA